MTSGKATTLRQCVILAGGLGTRLGGLTADTPKPVLPCGDRPFLAWLLRELQRFGFEEVVLLSFHLPERLRAAMDESAARLPKPMRIVYSQEPERAGTGGALYHAHALLDEHFLLCNGDSLVDANLAPLLAHAAQDGPDVLGRMLLYPLPDTRRYGVVRSEGSVITGFYERPEASESAVPGDINAGISVLSRSIHRHLRPVCSLERDVLPLLAAQGALRAEKITHDSRYFIDIGIPADLARAQTELAIILKRPALFLDRDGVINVDHGYVGSVERFTFIPGALAAIRAATDAGWHVFIVTNQSGVARGYYDEAAVQTLHTWLAEQVRQACGTIDDIRYCPTHPEGVVAAYTRVSDWRKPAPGMILDLLQAWELDPSTCLLVGDQPTDIAAATAAGLTGHLFTGGDLHGFIKPLLDRRRGSAA